MGEGEEGSGDPRTPWLGLGSAAWLQIAAGGHYTFPLFSSSLKSVMGYDQQQLTILGVANDIGENVGILPGIVGDRFPPWVMILAGSVACFLGYGVVWLAVSRTVLSLPYWLLWVALVIATHSSAWLGTAVLVTNMRNFPLRRGTVAGILKGYVGLSAAVYTEIHSGVLNKSSSNLLLFLTLGVPIICLAALYFLRPCTPSSVEDSVERNHFLFTQIASISLAIYLLVTTIVIDVFALSSAFSITFVVIMVLFLLSPFVIPIKMTLFPHHKKSPLPTESASTENLISVSEPLLDVSSSTASLASLKGGEDVSLLLAVGEGAVKKRRRPRRGEDFNFHQAVVKADFWLLFLVYFFGVGSGVTVLNNLAQIGIAVGANDTTILLSLFSFFNFVGRIGGGAVSEHFVRTKTIPRTLWMACTQVIMIVCYLLFASALDGTLYIATALLGICFGVQFSVMIPTASELFGLKNFGVIYNFMLLGNPLGALLFSGLLAGYVYDIEASKQVGETLGNSCLGPNCFRLTFYVLAGVCALGSILGAVLTVRTRPVYRMLYSGGSFRLPQASLH